MPNPHLEILRRPYQRHLKICVRPSGTLRITTGLLTSESRIQAFLVECQGWIEKQLKKYADLRRRFPPRRFEAGENFPFLGRPYALVLIRCPIQKPMIVLEPPHLRIFLPEIGSQTDLRRTIVNFYKTQGKKILSNRVEHYANLMGVQPKQVSFRSQRTRWGSCSRRGTLSLNWRLVGAPPDVLDYVVVHELAHLRHLDHSPRFWSLVKHFQPNYKSHDRWLNEHQYEFEFLLAKSELHSCVHGEYLQL